MTGGDAVYQHGIVMRSEQPPAYAEEAVLGAILLRNENYHGHARHLTEEHFTSAFRRRLWTAMRTALDAGKSVDAVVLSDAMPDDAVSILDLANTCITANTAEAHVELVCARWRRRRLAGAARQLLADLESGDERAIERAMDALQATTPTPQGLRPVALSGVMTEQLEEWPHIIYPYFPRRLTTLLAGHGGLGKSMLALIFAAHVAAGRPWGPFAVERGRAVFLSFEDEGQIVRARLRRIIEHYGLPVGPTLENLVLFDGSDAQAEMAIDSPHGLLFTPMVGHVEQAVAGADFVIIDNASEVYGGNEIARRQVKAFIGRLTAMARDNDAAVVLLAHVDKQSAKGGGGGQSYSGSTQWHNGVRSRLALVETDDGIELLHGKANLAPRHDDLLLSRAAHGVLEIAPAGQREAAAAAVADSDADAVYAVMAALIADGATIPTAETGQRTAYHVLSQAREFPEHLRGTAGKARAKAAVLALARARRIEREPYRSTDRKDRERWTLAQIPAGKGA